MGTDFGSASEPGGSGRRATRSLGPAAGDVRLVLLGPPGVGKGTQGRMLADEKGIPVLSTGDILRAAVREGTPLGRRTQRFMRAGELVPDGLIDEMMSARLRQEDVRGGFILDGYPRTRGQAEALSGVLAGLDEPLTAALLLEVSDDEVVRRLSGRRSCPACGRVYHVEHQPPRNDQQCDADGHALIHRDDDRPETVHNRLEVYRRDTAPVAGYYRERGLLVTVDAGAPPDEVRERTWAALAREPAFRR